MRTGPWKATAYLGSCAISRRALAIATLVVAAGVPLLLWSALTPAGAAGAQGGGVAHTAGAQRPTCVVHSLPSFVGQGEFALEATVADIVEIECNPFRYGTGAGVEVSASQLYERCAHHLRWYGPGVVAESNGDAPSSDGVNARAVNVALDADGSATVTLLAGPGCFPGESLIGVHMLEKPFETFTATFTVLPPGPTPEGVFALPASQPEDARTSSVATILEAEFHGAGEEPVRFGASELYARCRFGPRLRWVRMDGKVLSGTPEITGINLDNAGNAFVIVLGSASCMEGTSLIEADLETSPFTTLTTTFTVLPPQPTEEPGFEIEKLQQVGESGFVASPLTGRTGQTVEYRITVLNTTNVPETFSDFTDAHCDAGSIAGGPGSGEVQPAESATYTCRHVLAGPGAYTNRATVTATTVGGFELTQTSNEVEVVVAPEPSFALEKRQRIAGGSSGYTTAPLTPTVGQTIEYEITVTNTGNVALAVSELADPHCDAGTIAGGPGEAPLQPGASTTYTCTRLISAPGSYENVATVSAQPPGGAPKSEASNRVLAEASEATKPEPKIGKLGECTARLGRLSGASGSKAGRFTARISSAGVRYATFYLDGRKLKKLVASQAKHEQFAVRIDARRLSYGAHHVKVKAVMSQSGCGPTSAASAFTREVGHPRNAG
jgi:hypothetical protein